MNVLVMGAGVIGVTSAWYLAKAGHGVTVIDRNAVAARETSFANAGLIAPGHAYTWASPRAPKVLFKSLFRNDQALRLRLRADMRMWLWFLRFLRNCTTERARVNTIRKLKLCLYAQERLHEVVAETGVQYDARDGGLLYLYRDQASLEVGVASMRILQDNGAEMRVLDRDAIARTEPALEPVKGKIAGAIYAPNDESGDCRMFTQELAETCKSLGVRFSFETAIRGIRTDKGRITAVDTSSGEFTADAYVMALGCDSPLVGGPLGLDIPVYPVKGYSMWMPIEEGDLAPRIGGVDEHNLTAYVRLGDRLRFTATAEFAGYDLDHTSDDFSAMRDVAYDLFPNGGNYDRISEWACLRPMTPEGTPLMGRSRIANLFLNTGHGHMGWTMACGSGRILADLVSGRPAEIDLTGMTAEAA